MQKVSELEQELQNFEPRFMEIEERMRNREVEIGNYRSTMNEVNHEIFIWSSDLHLICVRLKMMSSELFVNKSEFLTSVFTKSENFASNKRQWRRGRWVTTRWRNSDDIVSRLEFDTQKSRLINQLEYEMSLDTKNNVVKWCEMIKNDEANIEKHKQEEKKAMKVVASSRVDDVISAISFVDDQRDRNWLEGVERQEDWKEAIMWS